MSRLHADWLISRKGGPFLFPCSYLLTIHLEYAQAQEFDQLRNIMKRGEAFVGFREAPINFPPTFKYDVLRTLKGKKARRRLRAAANALSGLEDAAPVDPLEEEDEQEVGESASMVSSAWNSMYSRNTDGDLDSDEDEKDLNVKKPSPAFNVQAAKIHLAIAADKVKRRWIGMINANSSMPNATSSDSNLRSNGLNKAKSVSSATSSRQQRANNLLEKRGLLGSQRRQRAVVSMPPTPRNESSMDIPKISGEARPVLTRSMTTKSATAKLTGETSLDIEDKGVYDSSSKQRVPSW